jgi:pre-mRNA-processing factor 17
MPPKGSVPTGHASEIALSLSTFKSQHRALETGRQPNALAVAGQKRKREGKGDTSVVFGENSYKGPWAKFKERTPEESESGSEIEVTDDSESGDEDLNAGQLVKTSGKKGLAPLATDYAPEGQEEKTEFHGESLYDYQGRTYMHVPMDLDINLR